MLSKYPNVSEFHAEESHFPVGDKVILQGSYLYRIKIQ